jgi:surfeit locus 1 family protein
VTAASRSRFWLVTIAAVLGIAATLALGGWQLSRAAQKEALQAAIAERKSLTALDGSTLAAIKNVAEEMWRPVVLQGTWLPQHIVFLDNRQMQAKPGFYVLTPLQLGDGSIVVVQRGWVQRNFQQRDRLPAVATPAGNVTVRGRIAPPPSKLYAFQGPEVGAIRQNLDLGEFGAQTRLPLRKDMSVQETGGSSDGLVRDWPEAGSGVEKHYGYAFQWFALATLISILYAWFQFVVPRRSRRA